MTLTGQGALSGLRVLDCSRFIAGPYCGMLLGDLGADVVKVERPQGGDEARSFGPAIAGETMTPTGHGALSGLRVLDCSRFIAGPYCGMLLGDLGADVVKVERPQGGRRGALLRPGDRGRDALRHGLLIGLSESPAAIRRPAPRLGEHTDEVLRDWLALTTERLAALRARGVVT